MHIVHISESQAMTDLLGGMMEGLGKLVAEEASKLLTKDNISEASMQFFANSNIYFISYISYSIFHILRFIFHVLYIAYR